MCYPQCSNESNFERTFGRVYPRAVAGSLLEVYFDPVSSAARVRFQLNASIALNISSVFTLTHQTQPYSLTVEIATIFVPQNVHYSANGFDVNISSSPNATSSPLELQHSFELESQFLQIWAMRNGLERLLIDLANETFVVQIEVGPHKT